MVEQSRKLMRTVDRIEVGRAQRKALIPKAVEPVVEKPVSSEAKLPSDLGVFTTGEVSYLTQIGYFGILEYLSAGTLKCYRVGGRGYRMVTRPNLLLFMKSNNIPLDVSTFGETRVDYASRPPKDFGVRA